MLVNGHGRAGQSAAPVTLVDLQDQILEADRIVEAYGAFELQREEQVKIRSWAARKGCALLGRGDLKTPVEFGDVFFPQKAVGLLDGAQAAQPELLR